MGGAFPILHLIKIPSRLSRENSYNSVIAGGWGLAMHLVPLMTIVISSYLKKNARMFYVVMRRSLKNTQMLSNVAYTKIQMAFHVAY